MISFFGAQIGQMAKSVKQKATSIWQKAQFLTIKFGAL
jgi:hypothetical protein